MSYSCEIRSSIDEVDLPAWRAMAGDDLFMDPRFILAVQRGGQVANKQWTALVRDETGPPAAIACLSLLPLDLAMLAGGLVKTMGDSLRRLFPKALHHKAIACGLPVSAGQSHLRIADGADVDSVLRLLTEQMTALAHAEAARFLVFKEFDEAEVTRLTPLTALGYYRGESPPMNHFPVRFGSFAEYRAALKAPYRSKISRSERKSDQHGLRLELIRDGHEIAQRFTDDVHRMYLAVVDKSPLRLEVLSAEWFRKMARQFDRESVWTVIYEGENLLAWAYGLLAHGAYHSLFGGVDYARNSETDAYFNLMYQELDYSLRQGLHDIQLGQTADDFKSRLGATQSKRWFYVKPLRWKAKAVLSLAAEHVLPKYPPPVERHVFHGS